MTTLSLGDLSQMFQLRRDTVRVRSDLAAATQELSSGKKANLGAALGGNYGPLVALDRQLAGLAGYQSNAREAAVFTSPTETPCTHTQDLAPDRLGPRPKRPPREERRPASREERITKYGRLRTRNATNRPS